MSDEDLDMWLAFVPPPVSQGCNELGRQIWIAGQYLKGRKRALMLADLLTLQVVDLG